MREEVRTQQDIIRGRRQMYTRAQKAIDPAGRVVVIVDDWIATGASMLLRRRSILRRLIGGHPFTSGEVRAQITAAEALGTNGWML